jgi:hypothetical protein
MAILYPCPPAEHVGVGDLAVLEHELDRARRTDAELVFLLAHGKALEAALDDEGGDALVAGGGVGIGKDDVDPGLGAVGDPQLASVEDPVVAVTLRARGEREGVGAGPASESAYDPTVPAVSRAVP